MAADAARKPVEPVPYPAGVDAEALAQLKRRPGFVEAVRTSARETAEIYRARLLNAVLNDRGRFMISSFALYLHFLSRRDPAVVLTAGRLRTLSVQQGVCSYGRAAAMIALMRWGGYLVPAPAPAGEGSERLIITGRLTAHMVERWRMQMTVMAELFPEARIALQRLDDARFIAAFALAQSAQFVAGFRFVDHVPELAVFFDRNGGLMILLTLVAMGSGERRTAPEKATISISALARRFGVSRPHVTGILRAAEAQGLLRRIDEDVRIEDVLNEAVEHFYALVYLLNLAAIRAALADLEAA